MAGNAALQAAERGRALIADAVLKKLEVLKNGCALPTNAYSIPPRRKRASLSEAV